MPDEQGTYLLRQSLWKGLRHFGIALSVAMLGGTVIALGNFHPEPGLQTYIWGGVASSVVGALTSLIDWLKKKDQ